MTKLSPNETFIKLPHAVYDSPAFAQLKPIDIAVLLLLIRKHNGYNNGNISLGLNEAAGRCHCSRATAWRSLARLQSSGLITLTYKGHVVTEIGRPDVPSRWRLNFVTEPKPKPKRTSNSGNSRDRGTQMKPSGRYFGETIRRRH